MAKSKVIRTSDVHALHKLAAECRDLGDDASLWWPHFAHRLAVLAGADFAACGQVADLRPEGADTLGISEWGWENGFNQEPWLKSVEAFDNDPNYSEQNGKYLRRLAEDDGVCLARTDLMGGKEWLRSTMYRQVNEPMGADHYLWCFRSLARFGGRQHGAVVLLRSAGRTDFHEREKEIVREANALVCAMVAGPLASFLDPSPSALPPRVRQVFRCLLEGETDKQTALRLGISPHTVNQYIKAIFNHFGVNSRAELLSRWVKRGWGGRFAWADEE